MIRMTGRYRRMLLAGTVLALAMTAAACAPRIDQRGNKPDEEQVVQINPGVDDKNRVAELIGTPSAISTFDDRTWYYISKRTETTAFFDPEVTDQEVLSSLKRDLIEKESIISKVRFHSLQDKLRTLFRKPDLLFGLAALQGRQVLVLNAGAQIEYG